MKPLPERVQEIQGFDWYDGLPASPVVRKGDLVFVSGQLARSARGESLCPGDVRAQAERALEGLRRLLEGVGGSLEDVVDVMSFHRDVRTIPDVLEAARGRFGPNPPAWTALGTNGTYDPQLLVSIRAIAHLGKGPKRSVVPDGAGWMAGYGMAAGCRRGDLICVGGQSGLDGTGADPAPGDHGAHAWRTYDNIRATVEALDGSMDDVVDICSYSLDPRGTVACEAVHNEFWGVAPADAPSWTAIAMPALFRPGMLAQYRVLADTSPGPRIGRASASINWRETSIAGASRKEGGRLVGIAGEVASDGEGNVTTPGDTAGQTRFALNRIREVLELHGGTMADVVEITSFHKDVRAWPVVMEAAREYFEVDRGPAWTPVGASGLWNPGYLHEIHALAVLS